jgi:hypothetical protein
MLSSAGEAQIAVPAAAAMAEMGVESVFATWLTECARFLHDAGVAEPVYVPRHLPPTSAPMPAELDELDRRFPAPGLGPLVYAEQRARYTADREGICDLAVRYLQFWDAFLPERGIDVVVVWTSSNLACRSAWSVARGQSRVALVIGSGPSFDHHSLGDLGEEAVWSELLVALASDRPHVVTPEEREEALALVAHIEGSHSRFKPRPAGLLRADVVGSLATSRPARALAAGLRRVGLLAPRPPVYRASPASVERFPDDPEERRMLRHIRSHLEGRRARWAWLRTLGLLWYEIPGSPEPYVYFPMQLEVGARLAAQNPGYADQIRLAEVIALATPPSCRVYVKEHPTHPGSYDWRRLRRLQRLPNVVLVDPGADNTALIRGARSVVVVSSTAGWEAFLARVPVVALGRTFYACSDLVFPASSANDLSRAIREAIAAGRELYAQREQEWLWFIHRAIATSNPGSAFGYKVLFGALERKEESNGTLIGRGIAKKLLQGEEGRPR